MATDILTSKMQRSQQPLRRKSKTGCRTCKKRKVKCDEGWPACRCCVSTGRVCDGYGIWGGGGNRYEQRSIDNNPVTVSKITIEAMQPKLQIKKAPLTGALGRASLEEQLYFDFFQHCTAAQLPMIFGPNFQKSILLQRSITEPAVLHALLALSACHKRKETNSFSRDRTRLPDKLEQFVLQQYSKAIHHLQPCSLPDGSHSIRTTLLTCLVFVYTEFIRGNYRTGYSHLQSGLRLIQGIRPERKPRAKFALGTGQETFGCHGTLDDNLLFAFERLHLLVALSSRYAPQHIQPPPSLLVNLPSIKYKSPEEARFFLNENLQGVKNATREFSQNVDPPEKWPKGYREILSSDQNFINGSLDSWLRAYHSAVTDANESGDADEVRAYEVLRVYHTMATIVTATCFSMHKQAIFDDHMPRFLSIITQSIKLLDAGDRFEAFGKVELVGFETTGEVPDLGWISPIYYTALKCRNHRIRLQAIKLLKLLHRSEGCHDFLHLARVAEEVVHLEEGDFFKDIPETEIGAFSNWQDLGESIPLPEDRRIEKVDAILCKDDSGTIELVCKRRSLTGWLIVRRMYDKSKKRWTSVAGNGSDE
ncbi:hypothetical protein P280DRAFT_425318 [Massarina eburnea CBS 473.64]|uniref:Zn(2)-C6 fungal-type domain-containing protein n=1 Tax=Massarina eburnea CBS 473.64 TaxID=1395130 RepID=A0A6A6S3W5_9PLEO|nr:hypothetical protein P280DRAFT_425318 [Massarina eburnea CBS 473.64]